MASIIKGDNSGAFGNSFLTIRANIPTGHTVTKAQLKIGNLAIKTYNNPTFPLVVNLTEAETRQLTEQNNCFLAVYDEQGRKATCKGTITFVAKDQVV